MCVFFISLLISMYAVDEDGHAPETCSLLSDCEDLHHLADFHTRTCSNIECGSMYAALSIILSYILYVCMGILGGWQ